MDGHAVNAATSRIESIRETSLRGTRAGYSPAWIRRGDTSRSTCAPRGHPCALGYFFVRSSKAVSPSSPASCALRSGSRFASSLSFLTLSSIRLVLTKSPRTRAERATSIQFTRNLLPIGGVLQVLLDIAERLVDAYEAEKADEGERSEDAQGKLLETPETARVPHRATSSSSSSGLQMRSIISSMCFSDRCRSKTQ